MTNDFHILQYQILEAATALFRRKGLDEVTMTEIAAEAGIDDQTLYLHFGSKYDVLLRLYQSINADWQIAVGNIASTKLHERFAEAMAIKLRLMDPYCDALASMMGHLLRSEKVGVGAARTAHIRQMGLATIMTVIHGASDGKMLKKNVPSLPSALYLMHWTLLLMHVQGGDMDSSLASVALAAKMLRKAKNASFFFPILPFVQDVGAWANRFVGDANPNQSELCTMIVKQIFQHRKLIAPEKACETGTCKTCIALHSSKVAHFVAAGLPIHFVLPAFPAKSPNRQKTLGTLPDLGEEIGLQTLQGLCDEIKAIYPPGAHVTICSDGRIFSELVEVSDPEITDYVAALRAWISQNAVPDVEILNLEDLLPGIGIDAARTKVLKQYAEPLPDLETRLKTNEGFLQLFNGIHRFIVEDRLVLHPEHSVSKTKEASKPIALQVIQHSNAWTRFLAQIYPDAIRLSIHPYEAHDEKIGIRLTKATDNWLTPWHGAIVLGKDGYVLMKAKEALQKGARIVERNGHPHHFNQIS